MVNALRLAIAATATLMAHASVAYAGADDTVLLKNGGRLTGTIVVEDPKAGVRIKLETGAVRSIPTDEIANIQYGGQSAKAAQVATATPAPAAIATPPAGVAAGSIQVESVEPGIVSVDGGVVGRAPATVGAAAVGRHKVQIAFDDGGSQVEVVLVQAGAVSDASFTPKVQRRSKGLMITGIVVGAASLAPITLGIYALTHRGQTAGFAFAIPGGALLAASIAGIVYGSGEVPVHEASVSAVPAVAVGPRSGSLTWRF